MYTVADVERLGGYGVIYADPAWSYRHSGGRGAAENHYRTTAVGDLAALPVSRLAASDAVLFLWATWPCLPEALDLMPRWGFKYKTLAFLWVKHRVPSGKRHVGNGSWTRANSEPCLLGVRGDARRADTTEARSVRQVLDEWGCETVDAPLGEHSSKPFEVRDKIVQLVGDLPKIELFKRGDRVPGWDQWGDECESDLVLA